MRQNNKNYLILDSSKTFIIINNSLYCNKLIAPNRTGRYFY